MLFSPTIVQYYHTPRSLIEYLSTLGGLIAVFNIGLVLRFYHYYKFENMMGKIYDKNKQKMLKNSPY